MVIIAKIKKWDNSRSLRMPKTVAQHMGLELGTLVRLTPVPASKYTGTAD